MVSSPSHLRRFASPIGRIEVRGDGAAVTALSIETRGRLPGDGTPERSDAVLDSAAAQLLEYLSGDRREFDVPVRLSGTPFQERVWHRLRSIGFGTTLAYGEVGARIGHPTASRAVGGAVGANPVPLIVPCHRVLAGNGRITGYSAGDGIVTKRWLLDLEGIPHR